MATMSNEETQGASGEDQEPTLYHMGLPGPFLVVGQSLRLVGAINAQGDFRSLALQTRYGLPSHDQKVVLVEGGDEALKMVLLAHEAAARFCCAVGSSSLVYDVIVEDERDEGS
ncbi:hypothetical protein FOQG_18514 [Fusarium oxysporum f. sp. raphani 54005]|uniref:Uncharacterized protein n=2 Tax=Fusarium oxysporum TaxID=5507 RepID=X0B4U4_FUSOX|nr:hypothetical protein FOVG_14980 [Fusarium oxysporum f. sp. pisi HDV247]EXK76756.1 hypothetical protein FOQG_18514 [Fusarium oxysporum f. sp. raphani 54005]